MKPGLHIGQTSELDVIITPKMVASFGDATIHKLYATSALVHHMEWVSRQLIESFFEDNEEGMGYHVDVSHLMPTIPGMKVRLKATVSDIKDKKVVCTVEAFNPRGKIARGTVTQAIVQRSWLENKIKEMTLVHQLSSASETKGRR